MRGNGVTIRYGAGRVVVAAAALAAAWSLVTLVSGGFLLRIGALAVSSRDPVRPLIASLVLLVAARLLLPGAAFAGAVRTVTGGRDRAAARIAAAAAIGVTIVSIAWNTRAAGGSDSSCYILQSAAFGRGAVALTAPLAGALPGATPGMFAPTGFVPSRIVPFTAVPICGPGLALAMTAASMAGGDAVFLVVPLFAGLAVWLTFVFARRLHDEVAGACAAIVVATSPVFLYQSVQPMSDVPAAALWLAALVALARGDHRGQVGAGLCASAAVLMRPNIALIVLPLLFLLGDRRVYPAEASQTRRRAWLRFGLAAVPGLAILAWLNTARYGSPIASGYGSTGVLFAAAHVLPNLARYPRWLFATETPLLAAAALAPWWASRHRAAAPLVVVSLAAVALTLVTYLAYTVFDDWWYLRFLLPALPVLVVLSLVVILEPVRDRRRTRVAAAIALGAMLGAWHLHVARARHVFELQALESRFSVTGRYAARALPEGAVVLAVQQSGSVRFHGRRDTLAWDAIPAGALDATIDALRAAGHPAFIALEDAEAPRFRERFSSQRFGGVDWPPRAQLLTPVRVRVFDPEDRSRYLAGERIATEYVR